MENSEKFNVVIALLILILIGIVGAVVLIVVPINVTRSCTYTTNSMTVDAVRVEVNWTARYKAPLIFPAEEKFRAENEIEVYGMIRVHAFACTHTAIDLKEMNKEDLQMMFDKEDVIKEILKVFPKAMPDAAKKLGNIKSVKLNELKFEQHFEDLLKKRNREKEIVDSLSSIMVAMKQNVN